LETSATRGKLLKPPSPQFWGSPDSKSPRIDAGGEFHVCLQKGELGELRELGEKEHIVLLSSKLDNLFPNVKFASGIRIGGFRGHSAVEIYYEIFRQQRRKA